MCALFRDRKPVEESGESMDAKPRSVEATAEFQRSTMWQLVGGIQVGRGWILR